MRRSASAGGTHRARARAGAPSRSRARAPRRRVRRAQRAPRARAVALARSARSSTGHVSADSGRRRVQRGRPRIETCALRPRTGSARAGCRRRSPPRARGTAVRAGECTRCRRGSGRGATESGRCEPRTALVERAPRVVVEERRRAAAARQAAFLETEHEDDVEAARARAQQVDAPRRGRARRRAACAACADRAPRRSLRAITLPRPPALELGQQPVDGLVRAQVERATSRLPAGARGRTRCGASAPRASARASTGSSAARRSSSTGSGAPRCFSVSSTHALRHLDGAAAQAALDEVDGAPLEPAERRAQEREQVAARAAEPREAKEGGERLAERRLRHAQLAVHRIRDAERAERGVERRAQPVDHGQTMPMRSAGVPARIRRSSSSPTSSSAPRVPAPSKKRTAPSLGDRRSALVGEERALDVCERRMRDVAVASGELVDVARRRGAAESSAVRRSEANAGRPGSYGSDTLTSVRPARPSSSAHSRR